MSSNNPEERDNFHKLETDDNAIITDQIVVTEGLDGEGEPQVWVACGTMNLVKGLGMLEAAKAHLIAQAYG